MAMDVKQLDPDFVLFPTYKWVLGPYGRAFLYVAKRHQNGIPLEQISAGRRDVRAENKVYFTNLSYVGDARRFDMGERDYFISMEMASIGMEMLAEWGAPAVVQRIAMLTDQIAEGVRSLGVSMPDAEPARAAYSQPRLQGRNAGGIDRGNGKRRRLCRAAFGTDACVAARL